MWFYIIYSEPITSNGQLSLAHQEFCIPPIGFFSRVRQLRKGQVQIKIWTIKAILYLSMASTTKTYAEVSI